MSAIPDLGFDKITWWQALLISNGIGIIAALVMWFLGRAIIRRAAISQPFFLVIRMIRDHCVVFRIAMGSRLIPRYQSVKDNF